MKRTSEKWQKICKVTVLDPDGWDRKDFKYSWYEEKITRAEFEERMLSSTCNEFLLPGICIWKDLLFTFFWYVLLGFKKIGRTIITEIERESTWDTVLPKISVYLSTAIMVLLVLYIFIQIIWVV